MKNAIIILALLLSACGSQSQDVKPNDPVLVQSKQTVVIPQEQLQDCAPLPPPESRDYSKKEMLDLMSQWWNIHVTCSLNNSSLIKTVKDAFNITDPAPVSVPSK
jgi:PBP1b-binding outer membrane lipoprotein LpoB